MLGLEQKQRTKVNLPNSVTAVIAMANGSLALSAAYLAIGLSQGDELITTSRRLLPLLQAQYCLDLSRYLPMLITIQAQLLLQPLLL